MDSPGLARNHLERRFMPMRTADFSRPRRGWIRAVRDALGMTTRQFAARMGKSQSTVVDLEKSEASDTISLGSLRKAAEALDCRLIYALVPNRPLDDILRERATQVAEWRLSPVSHSMALENQALNRDGLQAERERLVDDLLRNRANSLWEEP